MLVGTVLYCRTTYHRGPYMYYISRETTSCVFVKRLEAVTTDEHGNSTYSSETIIGVEECIEGADIEYRLLKRKDDDTLYFVGSADHGSSQRFYIWDGKPMKRDTYY
jgi:hypothetical protein